MARIIVASYLVRLPVGGYLSWMLQWLAGFQRLGHEVYFVEKAGWPNSCYDPSTWVGSDECSYGTAVLDDLLRKFDLTGRWCFVDAAGQYHGLSRDQIESVFQTADLFVDHLRACEWAEEAATGPVRVLVDGEPGFTQMQMVLNQRASKHLDVFDQYYSVGLNVGSSECAVPTAGKTWRPVFDPVVVDFFPKVPADEDACFTTIMSWQAHDPIEFDGATYGQKDIEFPKFIDLPQRTATGFELAIAGNAPHDDLRAHGWRLKEAAAETVSFDSWGEYIRGSRGEFSVCKNVFTATNSGFFSDRSAIYLASGRPVVMQETGFSSHLPCGRGLFAVRDVVEAAAAIDEIQGNYEEHSQWAREIAYEYLDASKVLSKFLHEIGI